MVLSLDCHDYAEYTNTVIGTAD